MGVVEALALDTDQPSVLYAGSASRGVFESTDAGNTWRPNRVGLPNHRILSMAFDPGGAGRLFAATSGAGVYRLDREPRLLLRGGRFAVRVDWRDFEDQTGRAAPVRLASPTPGSTALRSRDSAVLQFFGESNWEMLVKVLDGRPINGNFWVLLAGATDVEVTTRVTDTSCGTEYMFHNPLGSLHDAAIDIDTFTGCAEPKPPSCQPSESVVCLGRDGRFRVEVAWRTAAGEEGTGKLVELDTAGEASSDDSVLFQFFGPSNWELLVKVLDGCAVNGHVWVLSAATTNVEYTLRVTDLETGAEKIYFNPLGSAAAALADTGAFAACP